VRSLAPGNFVDVARCSALKSSLNSSAADMTSRDVPYEIELESNRDGRYKWIGVLMRGVTMCSSKGRPYFIDSSHAPDFDEIRKRKRVLGGDRRAQARPPSLAPADLRPGSSMGPGLADLSNLGKVIYDPQLLSIHLISRTNGNRSEPSASV
jgi:hypothetical protein